MKNTLSPLDMLLLNHSSATTLPKTLPAFTAFMNMKFLTETDSQTKQVKRLFMDCINACVKMFYYSPNMWNQVKIKCWKFN